MIVYLHGFNSTPGSQKAQTLHAYMKARGVDHLYDCPALPHFPPDAIRVIEAVLARHSTKPVTLLGSSLGGFYATYLAEKHNPEPKEPKP